MARLVPAIKHGDRIYKGKPGENHDEALPRSLHDKMDEEQKDYDDYGMKTGFLDHKGRFLDHRSAMDYAKEHGLVDPKYHKAGALTTDMLEHEPNKYAFKKP